MSAAFRVAFNDGMEIRFKQRMASKLSVERGTEFIDEYRSLNVLGNIEFDSESLFQAGVGFGDTVTLGFTKSLRGWTGVDGGVDVNSGGYTVGTIAGNVTVGYLGGAALGAGAGNLAAYTGNLNYVRFAPQSFVNTGLRMTGWTAGTMRGSTAARGGWSMIKGTGPLYRLQWSAAGGRHLGSYWKLSGQALGITRAPAYFNRVRF